MITVQTICPRCHRPANVSAKHPICPRCQTAIRQEAAREQERDYLARYLSTRADEHSVEATRLRQLARREGIDWTHPPAPLHFDARVSALLRASVPETMALHAGNKRGRPARGSQVSDIARTSLREEASA